MFIRGLRRRIKLSATNEEILEVLEKVVEALNKICGRLEDINIAIDDLVEKTK